MADIVFTVKIGNEKCLDALRVIVEALEESADAMPWRPELRRAEKAARYLVKNLVVVRDKGN